MIFAEVSVLIVSLVKIYMEKFKVQQRHYVSNKNVSRKAPVFSWVVFSILRYICPLYKEKKVSACVFQQDNMIRAILLDGGYLPSSYTGIMFEKFIFIEDQNTPR
jgi:hypothetical protein